MKNKQSLILSMIQFVLTQLSFIAVLVFNIYRSHYNGMGISFMIVFIEVFLIFFSVSLLSGLFSYKVDKERESGFLKPLLPFLLANIVLVSVGFVMFSIIDIYYLSVLQNLLIMVPFLLGMTITELVSNPEEKYETVSVKELFNNIRKEDKMDNNKVVENIVDVDKEMNNQNLNKPSSYEDTVTEPNLNSNRISGVSLEELEELNPITEEVSVTSEDNDTSVDLSLSITDDSRELETMMDEVAESPKLETETESLNESDFVEDEEKFSEIVENSEDDVITNAEDDVITNVIPLSETTSEDTEAMPVILNGEKIDTEFLPISNTQDDVSENDVVNSEHSTNEKIGDVDTVENDSDYSNNSITDTENRAEEDLDKESEEEVSEKIVTDKDDIDTLEFDTDEEEDTTDFKTYVNERNANATIDKEWKKFVADDKSQSSIYKTYTKNLNKAKRTLKSLLEKKDSITIREYFYSLEGDSWELDMYLDDMVNEDFIIIDGVNIRLVN